MRVTDNMLSLYWPIYSTRVTVLSLELVWFSQLLCWLVGCDVSDHGFFIFSRYLVEQRDVELNIRDKWDSTPL